MHWIKLLEGNNKLLFDSFYIQISKLILWGRLRSMGIKDQSVKKIPLGILNISSYLINYITSHNIVSSFLPFTIKSLQHPITLTHFFCIPVWSSDEISIIGHTVYNIHSQHRRRPHQLFAMFFVHQSHTCNGRGGDVNRAPLLKWWPPLLLYLI